MNFLYALYFTLPNFSFLGKPGKVINRILRMILKRMLDLFVPRYLKRTAAKAGYGLNSEKRDQIYIVSLTSFPARINEIWITIETIMRQSFKPDKIILWLGKDQFPDQVLPKNLEPLKKRGLSIEFVKDLRSHTKYYYALQKFPDANVITLDDDSYYPFDTIEKLVKLHSEKPELICANRVHKFTFYKNNQIKPYRQWLHNFKGYPRVSSEFFLTGVNGVLYPPQALHKSVFDKEIFKRLCFFADDIWLTIHAIRNNTKTFTGPHFNKDFVTVSKSQRIKLVSSNSLSGGNDEQLKNLLEHYGINLKEEINKLENQI